MQTIESLIEETSAIIDEYLDLVKLRPGDLFVAGISTSEVAGSEIGKQSNPEIGMAIVKTIWQALRQYGIDLALQGCEHINRSLVMERSVASRYGFDEVTVLPTLHAGGGAALAWFQSCHDPVVVEYITANGGIDIGDTFIGMHVKHVQIPVRLSRKSLGHAHVTCLTSRPKLIGGSRAIYTFEQSD